MSRSAPLRRTSHRIAAAFTALLVGPGWLISGSGAQAATDEVTIWGNSAPSRAYVPRDNEPVELGTRFTAASPGVATGIRFYKQRGMTGSHTGTLWSADGKQLASVDFGDEGPFGWQWAGFGKPVRLAEGAEYVVSYHVPEGGRYVMTRSFRGGSAAQALSVPGRNIGVYNYGSETGFPQTTWSSSQYWVDITYLPDDGPTPTPTPTVSPTPTPTPTVTPTPTPPPAGGFPTRDNTGVPQGWEPTREIVGDHTITQAGAVLEDVRITGGVLYVRAPNVTVRRVELVDARVVNFFASRCYNGLRLEDVSILRVNESAWEPVVEAGGYTADGVKIDGPWEGFRVGGVTFNPACAGVVIENSWVNIEAPDECWTSPGSVEWHGDALQGYMGAEVTLRNSYMRLAGLPPLCGGNATFFYPDQGNTRATVDNVLLEGGGFTFRLGTPGSVRGLKVVDGTWEYGPVDIRDCGEVEWGAGNEVVRVNANGSLTSVRQLSCS